MKTCIRLTQARTYLRISDCIGLLSRRDQVRFGLQPPRSAVLQERPKPEAEKSHKN